MSNYIHFKVWGEITYPFQNVNCTAVQILEWISHSSHFYRAWNYLSMLGLKLIQVSKLGPRDVQHISFYLAVFFISYHDSIRTVKSFTRLFRLMVWPAYFVRILLDIGETKLRQCFNGADICMVPYWWHEQIILSISKKRPGLFFNSSPPGQHGRRFTGNIFRCIFLNETFFLFWWKFHWSLFLRVQLAMTQHWFR